MTAPSRTPAEKYRNPMLGTRWMHLETRPFFVTSEFFFYTLMTIAFLITAAVDNGIDSRFFWRYEIPLTIGYMLARGIAKAGSRTQSYDPRDEKLAQAANRR
jgi:hypothetical protein